MLIAAHSLLLVIMFVPAQVPPCTFVVIDTSTQLL